VGGVERVKVRIVKPPWLEGAFITRTPEPTGDELSSRFGGWRGDQGGEHQISRRGGTANGPEVIPIGMTGH